MEEIQNSKENLKVGVDVHKIFQATNSSVYLLQQEHS